MIVFPMGREIFVRGGLTPPLYSTPVYHFSNTAKTDSKQVEHLNLEFVQELVISD